MTGVWDERATRSGLHSVFTERWSPAECAESDRRQREVIADVLPDLRDLVVLDLGCGVGRLTGWLAEGPLGTPRLVLGVDRSIRMAGRAAQELATTRICLLCADAERLPLRSGCVDVVVTCAVLQHLTAPAAFRAACVEVARVVQPGGVLVFIEGVTPATGPAARGPVAAATATRTVRRTLEEFAYALGPTLVLDRSDPLTCVEDEYTVMRWTRRREPE